MRRSPAGLLGSRCGNAAIEFALVAPVMILLIAGVVEIGTIIKVYNAANRLAAQFAIAWSDCVDFPAGTCLTELANYGSASAIANVTPQLLPQNTTLQMFEVRMTGSTPTVVYSYPAATMLSTQQISIAQATFSSGQVGVIVSVTYQHSLNFFNNTMSTYLSSSLAPSYTVAQLKS